MSVRIPYDMSVNTCFENIFLLHSLKGAFLRSARWRYLN